MTHIAANTATLPAIGEPLAGGFFAGTYLQDGALFALVIAPKDEGEAEYLEWGTGPSAETAARSLLDGLANSEAINDDNHPAAKFCRSLTIGGFSDWHLPALDQMTVLRANLMPDAGYVPAQTTAEAFKDGGPEALEQEWYWTSTEFSAGDAWLQYFNTGDQLNDGKGFACRVRAVRKFPL